MSDRFYSTQRNHLIGHISLGVSSYSDAKAFYTPLFATLGLDLVWDDAEVGGLGYGYKEPVPREWVDIFERKNADVSRDKPGTHIAFNASSRKVVDEFYKTAMEAGATSNGTPGLRQYGDRYYAAFVIDRDGHKLEAIIQETDA